MRRVLTLLPALLLLSACAAPAEEAPPVRESPEAAAPAETAPEQESPAETGDGVLLTLDAPLTDGRTLTLEAVGRVEDAYSCGVREVRVYDGEALLQTVTACEAIEIEWGSAAGDPAGEYTNCWSPEETMEVLDLNFDGNADFGLFGWTPNNTIPYYYWIWDGEAEQYRYAFTLQGAEVHPEAKELTVEYKDGPAGALWVTEHYKFDENGRLALTSREEVVRDDQS